MRKNELPRSGRHARSQAVAIARSQHDAHHKFLVISAYLIASAIVAMWMAYLPTVAGNFLTQLNILPQHVVSNSVNRLHKGDQLATIPFADRWSAVGAMSKSMNVPKSAERIPFGCESAFSRLVKAGNFSARCVAGIATSTRLAAAE
jgi:hypothetical protein